MNNTTALHRQAMLLMDQANEARKIQDVETADTLLRSAYKLEATAADSLRLTENAEPSRAILYRSAASLAFQCGFYSEAESLIHRGLAGEPPVSIAEELRQLLDSVSFQNHLSLRGLELSNVEIQVVLEGNGIGPGIAPTAEVIPRLEGTNLLLFRTAERISEREYRPAGPPKDGIRDIAESFIGLPRAASYAFSLKVGRLQQMSFADPSEHLLDELLDCLSLIEEGDEAKLRKRIPNAAYYNNFVALAQTILPDGDRVKTVGFTVQRNGSVRELALRHTPTDIRDGFRPVLAPGTKKAIKGNERPVEVSGQLRLADSVHETNRIQIVSELGSAVTVYVPEGMMTDIVKPLWDEWVTIDGLKMGRTITLMNIRRTK